MPNRIVVAGSTGDLGTRIVKALVEQDVSVIALARQSADVKQIDVFSSLGATVEVASAWTRDQIATVCRGADCVVSSLSGLRDVIVDAQNILLDGAIQAGVPRFIPSDFSTDFRKLTAGENRNFDVRREFHARLAAAPIASTSIFNGAFAEILKYNIPILDFKNKRVGYWGDPNHRLDFTTMHDTAAYTAAAALDTGTPRALNIASFQCSPNDLLQFAAEISRKPWTLVCMGTVDELSAQNKLARIAHPEGENELYCRWQQGQYMQSMFSTSHESLDNGRYPEMQWTGLKTFLRGSSLSLHDA